ncbi:hypothetical protein CUMW_060690 [Citrus unshiu]|uniref:Uncharacterized protein n=1 Tax=Citrus unshiu TaxID=55188 RepID=A0A2H5NN29_CITUN|nr:hypothetical protein CUMW_060690 [Citrus unshiu]GAY41597.1 hypothetical protein CUMW_060690 [Citrus unshiu]GAY41598.1 hypothetical protein CUMW_060690 [Citrus unshiu]
MARPHREPQPSPVTVQRHTSSFTMQAGNPTHDNHGAVFQALAPISQKTHSVPSIPTLCPTTHGLSSFSSSSNIFRFGLGQFGFRKASGEKLKQFQLWPTLW